MHLIQLPATLQRQSTSTRLVFSPLHCLHLTGCLRFSLCRLELAEAVESPLAVAVGLCFEHLLYFANLVRDGILHR